MTDLLRENKVKLSKVYYLQRNSNRFTCYMIQNSLFTYFDTETYGNLNLQY